jgi:hypothetical protein
MFGLKKKPVDEHEAEGEVERVYHEIRQTLRVTGINLVFRIWARYEKFFPAMWETIRANAATRIFEDASDAVRAQAVRAADGLGRLNVSKSVKLGESQAYQIKAALDLYHYINPKLLLIVSAVRLALAGEHEQELIEGAKFVELIEGGVPEKMYPMEMVSEDPKEDKLQEVFSDIKRTLAIGSINSDYRTLALWPDYLVEGWRRMNPFLLTKEYVEAAHEVRQKARAGAFELPYPVISREGLEETGEDFAEIMDTAQKFENLLAPLILNIALFQLDWHDPQRLMVSPFPAAAR